MRSLTFFGITLAVAVASTAAIGQPENSSSAPTGEIRQNAKSSKAGINPCRLKHDGYPTESARNNEQGTSRIRFSIDAEGSLEKAEISKSSGYQRLDEAAMKLLSQCTFKAARDREGKPISGTFDVEYVWQIK